MDILQLRRTEDTGAMTTGELWIANTGAKGDANELYLCDTLEPEGNDFTENKEGAQKERNKAIPYGTYKITITSPTHIAVHNVPQYSGVYIHTGNTREDTTGCILCGLLGYDDKLHNSREQMTEVQKYIRELGIEFMEVIKDDDF